MLALRFEYLAIGYESVEDFLRLRSGDSGEIGLDLFEAPCTRFAGDRFGELVEIVKRGGTLGFYQGLMDRLDCAEAMDLEAAYLEERHFGEGAHLFGVTHQAVLNRIVRGRFLVAGFAACENKRCSHALEIPFERRTDSLIEVVNVEDEAAIGGSEGAEVAYMGVSTDLGIDAGVGNEGEIGSHDGSRSAEESERRLRHELVLQLEQRWDATALDALE